MDASELVHGINEGEIITIEPLEGEYDYAVKIEAYVASVLDAEIKLYVENLLRAPGITNAVYEDGKGVLVNAEAAKEDLDRWTRIWWANRLTEIGTLPDSGGV